MDRCMNVWNAWAAELVRVAAVAGIQGPVDVDAFRSYYEEGDTPAYAWLRDLREGQ